MMPSLDRSVQYYVLRDGDGSEWFLHGAEVEGDRQHCDSCHALCWMWLSLGMVGTCCLLCWAKKEEGDGIQPQRADTSR